MLSNTRAYLHEIAKHFDCTAAAVCYALKLWGGVSFVIVGNTKKKGEILIKTGK